MSQRISVLYAVLNQIAFRFLFISESKIIFIIRLSFVVSSFVKWYTVKGNIFDDKNWSQYIPEKN